MQLQYHSVNGARYIPKLFSPRMVPCWALRQLWRDPSVTRCLTNESKPIPPQFHFKLVGELYHKGLDITYGVRCLLVCFTDGMNPKILEDSKQEDDDPENEKNVFVYWRFMVEFVVGIDLESIISRETKMPSLQSEGRNECKYHSLNYFIQCRAPFCEFVSAGISKPMKLLVSWIFT